MLIRAFIYFEAHISGCKSTALSTPAFYAKRNIFLI
jgi:hypothetical protein